MKIYIFCMIFTLAGCQFASKPIVKTKTTYLEIPPSLLTPCDISPPIPDTVYLNKSYRDRTTLLTTYTIYLIKDLNACSNKILTIKKLENEYKELYKEDK